jgi:cytochrome c-type biogenesis protein CcmH/NrfG
LIFYNYPAERDVLARAYVQKGALDDAIAEYERLVRFDPDSNDRRLIYAKFHYRLGVLYEQNGQIEIAAQRFEMFLEICGDADPELAEVTDARRRMAALTGD